MNLQLREVRICFIGDSFVNGTSDPECRLDRESMC